MTDTLAAMVRFASIPTLRRWASEDPCVPTGVRNAARRRLEDIAEVKRANGFRHSGWMYDRPKRS